MPGSFAIPKGVVLTRPSAWLFRNEPIPQELYSLDDKDSLAVIDQSPASAQPRPALLETLTRLEQGFSIEGLESRLIDEALQQSEGNLAAAARLLGLSRAQLAYWLKKYQQASAERPS